MFLTPPSPDVVHECSSCRCWYKTIFTLIERFYHIFIIMNLIFCAKELRQTRGAAPHRFLSLIDICADPWNAAYAHVVRIVCVWPAAFIALVLKTKLLPEFPKMHHRASLNFKIFPGEHTPRPPYMLARFTYTNACNLPFQ